MGVTTIAKVAAASAVAIFGTTFINPAQAGATAMNVSKGSVELIPRCVDANSGKAVWEAFNKNDQTVTVSWTNLDSNVSGSYAAANGSTWFVTDYKAGLNNNTQLSYATTDGTEQDVVTRNTNNGTTCTPEQLGQAGVQPVENCLTADEITSADVQATFIDRYHAAVKYIASTPLCDGEQVQINFSGYVIVNPAYNGGYLENNPTATPQVIYANHTAYLTNKNTDLNLYLYDELATYVDADGNIINLGQIVKDNEACFNIQNDVYRGEIILGFNDTIGHGEWNIKSEIYPATATCEEGGNGGGQTGGNTGGETTPTTGGQITQPGMGGGVQTAAAVTPVTTAQPAELANTGERSYVPAILAAVLSLTALAVVAPLRRFNRAN